MNRLLFFLLIACLTSAFACVTQQTPLTEEEKASTATELLQLSKDKWVWMAEKDTEKLAALFHGGSKFVHMSGSWNKARELEIIESGSIWYKKAEVHDAVVEVFSGTSIVWNRITLEAVVRGNTVSNEFTVTEVYRKGKSGWQLLNLTFSSVRDTHKIEPSALGED